MPATYEPIASTTLGSDAANVEFSSIAGTYTDLRLVMMVQQQTQSASYIRVNSLTTNIYSVTSLSGDGSSATSTRFNATTLAGNGAWVAPQGGVTNTDFTTVVVDFLSYANSNVFKTVLASWANNAGSLTPTVGRAVNLVQTTNAITTLTIRPVSGNWKSGSTFSLYGIKAA